MGFNYNDDDQKTWNVIKQIDLQDFKCIQGITFRSLTAKKNKIPDSFKIINLSDSFRELNLISKANEMCLLDNVLLQLSLQKVPLINMTVDTIQDNLDWCHESKINES